MGAIKASESMQPSMNPDMIDENPNPSTQKVYVAPRAVVTHQDSFTEDSRPESPVEAYRRPGMVLSGLKVAGSPRAYVVSKNISDKDFGSLSSVGSPMSGRTPRGGGVGLIDTAAPFESVKEVVSQFGGITDWKAHKMNKLERRKHVEQELERVEQDEIENHKEQSDASEEEKTQTEEQQAKQDSELAKDSALRKTEDAAMESTEVERKLEEMTVELTAAKELLESARTEHLEAEERRMKTTIACNQDVDQWEKELKIIEDETEISNQKTDLAIDVKTKLETASVLLLDLKAELAACMEDSEEKRAHKDTQSAIVSAKKELEEVRLNIERANSEVDSLKAIAGSFQSEIERQQSDLAETKQIERTSSTKDSSLEAEMELQEPAEEADETKLAEETAREELRKAKEEAEQKKAELSTLEGKLAAAKREVEAARASERVALSAIKALQESEMSEKNEMKAPRNVLLSLQEYYELSKQAHKADEQANNRVAAAESQIETAKENEARILEKLEEVNREMALRNEELKIMTEKANKATEGKLGMEQELQRWREEHEQQKMKMTATDGSDHTTIAIVPVVHGNRDSNSITEMKTKKRLSLLRIFMFLSRKKSHK